MKKTLKNSTMIFLIIFLVIGQFQTSIANSVIELSPYDVLYSGGANFSPGSEEHFQATPAEGIAFWQTGWFLAVFVGLVLVLAFVVYRLKIQEARRQNEELESKLDRLQEEQLKHQNDGGGTVESEVADLRKENEELRKLVEGQNNIQKPDDVPVKGSPPSGIQGGIIHDFNNVLAIILGFCKVLKHSEVKYPEKEARAIEKIVANANNAKILADQLLGLVRVGKQNRAAIDLNHQIKDELDYVEKIFDKEVKVILSLAKDLKKIEGDPVQINQILTNLLLNAKDAMPEGGELVFKTQNIFLDDEIYENDLNIVPGNYVSVSVSDTGVGIPGKALSEIFKPFYTTKEAGKGTGLGLAMVYEIVKNHGGDVICESEQGKGTTITMYFPVFDRDTMLGKPSSEPFSGTGTILVVEDSEDFRELLLNQLDLLGYTVIGARDGYNALDIYSQKANDIDMLIIDMLLPGMSGKETYLALKELNPNIRVLIMSAYSEQEIASNLLQKGARGFVQKPFGLDELSKAVADALKN